jgi:uncharacterized membrane protein YeiH
VIAFTVACGGGVLRDLCIGAIPPAGLADWRYLTTAVVAAVLTMASHGIVERLAHPVVLFDTLGLESPALTWCAVAVCFALRMLSLRFRWNLPRFKRKNRQDAGDSLSE